jgi:hypothetical protein
MRLPNPESSYIPRRKLTGYLLSEVHPVGKAKARFLRTVGFGAHNAESLEQELLRVAREGEVEETISSAHGTKYVVSGEVKTPSAHSVRLRTVWIVEVGDNRPRFVTAFPA